MSRKKRTDEIQIKFFVHEAYADLIKRRMNRLGLKTYADLFAREAKNEAVIEANSK